MNIFARSKTIWTLPPLWTHRTRPTGVWKSRTEREIPTASTSIIVFSKEKEERRTQPLRSTVHGIGSAPTASRIDSGGVSRHHARVVVQGDEARVEDLGSKNGTFIDGALVTDPRVLNDGDEIRVGPVALTFKIAPPTQATETMG
ncbi:MAG: FHA domain-containing protein [Chloroflexota bacterium]|nr:FHA domain-containing protein [Chloroflexota bacterium]